MSGACSSTAFLEPTLRAAALLFEICTLRWPVSFSVHCLVRSQRAHIKAFVVATRPLDRSCRRTAIKLCKKRCCQHLHSRTFTFTKREFLIFVGCIAGREVNVFSIRIFYARDLEALVVLIGTSDHSCHRKEPKLDAIRIQGCNQTHVHLISGPHHQ